MQLASGSLPVVSGTEPRRLAAFVHADMVGYSRLIEQDDIGTCARLARLRHILIDPALERYGGKIDNTAGDALLMEFSSVLSAVRFAVEIQTRIPEFDNGEPPDRRIRFRMGVNAGDAISDGADIHGDSVNIAARLQAVCPPGCVCVSTIVRNHVQERLDLQFEPMGTLHLKNIVRPIEAFVVRLDRGAGAWTVKHLRARKWAMATLLLSLCLIAGGLGVWLNTHRMTPEPKLFAADSSIPPLSIAVLPFANLSNDSDQEYLAEGISEDLTTDLSHLEGVFVVARESAFTYLRKQVDIREVGRQLGVRYVLEGSVRKLGDAVRINAQLISAIDGNHVWADRFDQPLRDLQAGQDSTVKRIGAALNIKFDKAKQQPQNPSGDPAAYDLVLRARAVLQEPRSDIRNTIAAGYFEQALRLDSTSVPAKVGVATMLIETNQSNRRDTDPYAARINRAADLIASAGLVTPNSPDVLAAKFRLLIRQQRYQEAVATFGRLLDIDSSAAGIAAEFVKCGRCWGRPEDAVPLIERTARLNPLSADRYAIYAMLGRMLIMLGRDTEAIGWLERGLGVVAAQPSSKTAEREPGDFAIENTKLYLAAAYALSGRLDEAHAMLASAMSSELTMDFTVRTFLNGIPAYYDTHRQEQERRIAEGLHRAGLRDHLDEDTDYHIQPTADLQDKRNGPTPLSVPGATTIRTEDMVRLLETKPLVLTTAVANPTIPGAIHVNLPNSGNLTDEWQTALARLVGEATNGDKQRPILTFAYSINRWDSRNLALRLIALGYTNVYWYRGGWEAWDAHDLPKAPLVVQFSPPR
jgi:TolB-like protein/class 3 adenylate cyclase/rhodanese-related sulfurtransferase